MATPSSRQGTPVGLDSVLKRRRVSLGQLTPTDRQGEFLNAEDDQVYVNTYGRANLLRKEFVEASEAKDVVIEEQRRDLSHLRQRLSILESEKASAKAEVLTLEQAKTTRTLRERTDAELHRGNPANSGPGETGAGGVALAAALKVSRDQQLRGAALISQRPLRAP